MRTPACSSMPAMVCRCSGQNYLVPVDAALESEVDLPFEAVSVNVVLDLMEQTTPLRLMFLDACRDNPLARSLSRASSRALGSAAASPGWTTGPAP